MVPIATSVRPPSRNSSTATSQVDQQHRQVTANTNSGSSVFSLFRPPSPSPTSPSINSLSPSHAMPPSPKGRQRHDASDLPADHYRSSSEASPVVFSSLQATPYQSPAPSPKASERRNSLDDFIHVDAATTPSLPTSASGSSKTTHNHLPTAYLANPATASAASSSSSPGRKWSFNSLLSAASSAVASATPVMPRVSVRKATQSINAWFSPHRAAKSDDDASPHSASEDGETAQEGMEEQIEPEMLVNDGEWEVAKLEYGREQRRNYRFVSKRTAELREAWFVSYAPQLEKQMRTWSGKDIVS